MKEPRPTDVPAEVEALEDQIAEVREEAKVARADLEQIQHEVEEAKEQLWETRAAQLLEANARLTVAAQRAQTAASTCEEALEVASRATALDTLTELPNRAVLLDRLATAIAHAKRDGKRLALLFLDLDDFKSINDTLGHAAGDAALKITADCLRASVREVDTVSRHGGDEFLILLSEIAQVDDAVLVADKVIAALDASPLAAEHSINLTVSVGISVYPDHGEEAEQLIGRADRAMYAAKRERHTSSVFSYDES